MQQGIASLGNADASCSASLPENSRFLHRRVCEYEHIRQTPPVSERQADKVEGGEPEDEAEESGVLVPVELAGEAVGARQSQLDRRQLFQDLRSTRIGRSVCAD
eukprot:268041-Pleurochrysis_carterae.AAC.5